MKRRVTDYWLYQHRYVLGYSLTLLAVVAALVAAALFVPAGLRNAELDSAIISGGLSFQQFDPQSVVNLPYHLLQRASFAVLGVGEFSLKLPSLLLGLLGVVGMFLLAKEWFRHNVAVISVLMTATLPAYIFIAQDATPQIYAVTVAIWLLVAGTFVSRRRKPHLLWKILFFVMVALNLYAPLGLYLNLAVLSTIVFHPHIRYLARRLNPNRVAIATAIALIVLAPLLYGISTEPTVGLKLLGIPTELPDFGANALALAQTLFWQQGSTDGMLHPVVSVGVLVIAAIGFGRFLQVKYTARSYIIWLWGLLLFPLLLLNPQHAVIVLPLLLLMVAMGMNALIAEWYKLFPYNPYARILGLIPLTVIVVGIVLSSTSRYSLNYYYNPELVSQFSTDTQLLKQTLEQTEATSDDQINVVVTADNEPFYRLLASYDQRFAVSSDASDVPLPYIRSADGDVASQHANLDPSYIAVDATSSDSARFYLYTAADE